jgi:putative transcriptional regulator
LARFTLDPNNLPRLSAVEKAELDARTDAELTAAAMADPDNPPLSDDELARMEAARAARGRS